MWSSTSSASNAASGRPRPAHFQYTQQRQHQQQRPIRRNNRTAVTPSLRNYYIRGVLAGLALVLLVLLLNNVQLLFRSSKVVVARPQFRGGEAVVNGIFEEPLPTAIVTPPPPPPPPPLRMKEPTTAPVATTTTTTTTVIDEASQPQPTPTPTTGAKIEEEEPIGQASRVPPENKDETVAAEETPAARRPVVAGIGDEVKVLHRHEPKEPEVEMESSSRQLLPEAATPADRAFFVVLDDSRSGAEWLLRTMSHHTHVCTEGSSGLMPEGFSWFSDASDEKACTVRFLRDQVALLVASSNEEEETKNRCSSVYLESEEAKKDDLGGNLVRMCDIVKALNGTYTLEAILKLYVEYFRSDQFVGCTCPADSRIRGLKVQPAWVQVYPSLLEGNNNNNNTAAAPAAIGGTDVKMIRFHRKNLWARFMSIKIAMETNMWGITSETDKERQLQAFKDKHPEEKVTISIDEMFEQFFYMKQHDDEADAVAKAFGKDRVLWLEHEECLTDLVKCFSSVYDFLGVSRSHVTEHADLYKPSYQSSNTDRLLDYVANPDLVRESLSANGMGEFIGAEPYEMIRHFVHVPDGQISRTTSLFSGVTKIVVEGDSKFADIVPHLKELNPDDLVVISGREGVALNHHIRNRVDFYTATLKFHSVFKKLTNNFPGAIVLSTSNQCCVSALTHVEPGAFFDENNGRQARSCLSGTSECIWSSDEKAVVWQNWLKEVASERSASAAKTIYPDASLIAGKAQDVLTLIAGIDISHTEDERAVLTDYFYRNPKRIVLDYEQRLFAVGFDGRDNIRNQNCVFDLKPTIDESFFLSGTKPLALFSYTPQDLGCSIVDSTENSLSYPAWDERGIDVQPLLDHIDNLSQNEQSLSGVDLHFGPEMLYVVDENGVWASNKIRSRIVNDTLKFRNNPTEGMLIKAYKVLLSADKDSSRWKRLQNILSTGGFFYFGWNGDFKDCNFHNAGDASIPLFTTCAIVGCSHTFPAPAYMTLIDSQESIDGWSKVFQKFDIEYPWEKKIPKVLWRGALSENDPSKVFESARWRLCKLATNSKLDVFDVGIVEVPVFLTRQMEIDVSVVGGLVEPIRPMNDFQRYMAVLDMDGNSWSSRFGTLLCYNSVAVKVEPLYVDYFFYDLKPWKHYVPVKADLSDLEENIAFIMDPKNELVVKNIIAAGNRWCSERFVYSQLASDMLDAWEAYLHKLDLFDPSWAQKWQEKKTGLFASDLKLQSLPFD